jgi:hypothetical protein
MRPVGVDEVAEQFSFDSRCPKCNLLAHQQSDADTLKADLESDEFRLYVYPLRPLLEAQSHWKTQYPQKPSLNHLCGRSLA